MKKNQSGSALIVGIFVTMLIVIIAIYLLEKIIPFSRDIKGIENGNISYYRANTALNEALLSMSGSDPSIGGASGTLSNGSGAVYQIASTGTILPKPGLGNSEYDKDWSIIALGKPVQLILSNGLHWDNTSDSYFTFRVPDLDGNGSSEVLSGSTLSPIINWSLSASGDTLQANGNYLSGAFISGSYIMASEINNTSNPNIYLGGRLGRTISESTPTFTSFYNNNCMGSTKCTLKLSLVNPLLLNVNSTIAPYIEYQAHFDQSIPLQTAIIETQGYAGGFRKNITRFIQQMTTNEALEFTVFQ